VQLQPDVIIEPQTHLRKYDDSIGESIGPGSLIENSQLGENVTVLYSVVINSIVQELRLVLMPICVLKLRWDLAAV